MASYNWDHQDVILRVVGSLQGRGYLVWVDTEQMKGSTVDTMALAVEGSELMLIGVSRAYKESSNCRMEAQYGMQKKKPLIPLKLTDGYEADGWLGLLLGASMWYAFYGEAVSSDGVFDSRIDALCRELGGRGRADAVVATEAADESSSGLHGELRALKPTQLRKRAKAAGADPDALDAADDADAPKEALIALIVELEAAAGGGDALRAELEGMKVSKLKKRAAKDGVAGSDIEEADDAAEPKEQLVRLILAARGRDSS
jgi:hypothetical protein